jgi:maltose alpha-D-glucosyltransferase/alpha-amylase
VWSDNDRRYAGTRIIFTDTEKSNWTWDPVAKAYYWHRFFSHQPDLNFDQPRVLDEVLRVMRFWMDLGVDGLRLDAVPYLCEREGTNNENLPETHEIIRRIRRELDRTHPNRMLLAEANQWPEDVMQYFGEADECHMAFHFPLMPRLYMAIAQEDRHPITDIMHQTPDIPPSCQWAIFLRNHDELTLEMVTDRERDYLWETYATDRRMRLNLGIRRRLAPLVEGDRGKIELLNSLLLSMPGTPVLYYGDEIAMGDNIYLGDRNGVRTPMQWTPDRNGGFSRADPARLYLPPIMDPVFGFTSINVEAQSRRPTSLLNWTRRLIGVRKSHRAFGRGTIRFLHPGNRKVLVYLREHDDDVILCVANLSRAAQPVELKLGEYAGRVPVELIGRSVFPPVGELPYFISLPAYGFYWFLLTTRTEAPRWHEPSAPALPEFRTLVIPQGWKNIRSTSNLGVLERTVLPEFLARQRWFPFAQQAERIRRIELTDSIELPGPDPGWLIGAWRIRLRDGSEHLFYLPLAIAWEQGGEDPLTSRIAWALGRVRRVARVGCLFDAMFDEAFSRTVAGLMRAGPEIVAPEGRRLRFTPTRAMAEIPAGAEGGEVRRIGQERLSMSVAIGSELLLNSFRLLRRGISPHVEMSRYLTEATSFRNTPRCYGVLELVTGDGEPVALAVLEQNLTNQGDAWTYTLEYLGRFLDEPPAAEADPHGPFRRLVHRLGSRLAELHTALAHPTQDPAFRPEPATDDDLDRWRSRIDHQLAKAKEVLQHAVHAEVDEKTQGEAIWVLESWDALSRAIDELTPASCDGCRTRYHGNLGLEQVLIAKDDVAIIDFTGEPSEGPEGCRGKDSPLRDVASLCRSFHAAAWTAAHRYYDAHPDGPESALARTLDWRRAVVDEFLDGYRDSFARSSACPSDPRVVDQLIDLFRIEKALQEITPDSIAQPVSLRISIQALLRLSSAAGSAIRW